MRVLFIHPNFPAQFRHITTLLGQDPRFDVVFATANPRPEWRIPGVRKIQFSPAKDAEGLPEEEAVFDHFIKVGKAANDAFHELRRGGFNPDVVVGHCGWGTLFFLQETFPKARLLTALEWTYNGPSSARVTETSAWRVNRLRAGQIQMELDTAACATIPTLWQLSQFQPHSLPPTLHIHEGVDPRYFAPADWTPAMDEAPHHETSLAKSPAFREVLGPLAERIPGLDAATELVTYVSRGFEPYRGFPEFMRALPRVLQARPGAHVALVGSDRICYGSKRTDGRTWREQMFEETQVDTARVHCLGNLPYGEYRRVLQAATAHVYLTRPFVLSWSMLEAMACGALLVASDTPPVTEVVQHGANGLLVPLTPEGVAEGVINALEQAPHLGGLRREARRTVQRDYDVAQKTPLQRRLVECLAHRWPPEEDPQLSRFVVAGRPRSV